MLLKERKLVYFFLSFISLQLPSLYSGHQNPVFYHLHLHFFTPAPRTRCHHHLYYATNKFVIQPLVSLCVSVCDGPREGRAASLSFAFNLNKMLKLSYVIATKGDHFRGRNDSKSNSNLTLRPVFICFATLSAQLLWQVTNDRDYDCVLRLLYFVGRLIY